MIESLFLIMTVAISLLYQMTIRKCPDSLLLYVAAVTPLVAVILSAWISPLRSIGAALVVVALTGALLNDISLRKEQNNA